jgi:predicted RNA-binding protein with PIN domain
MNKIIIDGYNLAHKIPQIAQWIKKGDTEKAIRLLINWLLRGHAAGKSQIILALDGKRGYFNEQTYSAHIKLIFSRKPQTADDIIRNFIRNSNNPAELTIVSSDNEIIYTAKDHGAKSIKSEEFIRQQRTKSQNKKDAAEPIKEKYNPENIDMGYWLNLFGDDKSK